MPPAAPPFRFRISWSPRQESGRAIAPCRLQTIHVDHLDHATPARRARRRPSGCARAARARSPRPCGTRRREGHVAPPEALLQEPIDRWPSTSQLPSSRRSASGALARVPRSRQLAGDRAQDVDRRRHATDAAVLVGDHRRCVLDFWNWSSSCSAVMPTGTMQRRLEGHLGIESAAAQRSLRFASVTMPSRFLELAMGGEEARMATVPGLLPQRLERLRRGRARTRPGAAP